MKYGDYANKYIRWNSNKGADVPRVIPIDISYPYTSQEIPPTPSIFCVGFCFVIQLDYLGQAK